MNYVTNHFMNTKSSDPDKRTKVKCASRKKKKSEYS